MQQFYIPRKSKKPSNTGSKPYNQICFPMKFLIQQYPLPKNSSLRALNPYFDEDGFIRIRGRLRRTYFLEDESHHLTRSSAVSTHYPTTSFKKDACRCSIDARVIEK